MQILSDITEVDETAQQEPHRSPWFQMCLIVWQFGHSSRESNDFGNSVNVFQQLNLRLERFKFQ